jgi:hypothetical protein
MSDSTTGFDEQLDAEESDVDPTISREWRPSRQTRRKLSIDSTISRRHPICNVMRRKQPCTTINQLRGAHRCRIWPGLPSYETWSSNRGRESTHIPTDMQVIAGRSWATHPYHDRICGEWHLMWRIGVASIRGSVAQDWIRGA